MIISADIHIRKYSSYSSVDEEGRNSRLMDTINVLQKLCEMANLDDGHLIIAGDLFDERDHIETEAYYLAYQVLKDAKASGVEVSIILGNHEVLEKNSLISALYPLESVARVVPTPSVINIGSMMVACLPWLNDWSKAASVVADLSQKTKGFTNKVLIGHVPIIGAVLGASNYRLKEGCVSQEDVMAKDFLHVILGHYHMPQTVSGNVHYVGSPLQLNFGEASDNKRVFCLDTASAKLTSVTMTGHPKFYEGAYADGKIHILTEDAMPFGFLKVYCSMSDDLRQVQHAIDDAQSKYKFRHVQLERIAAEKKQEARLAVTSETKDADVISSYANYVMTDLDKTLLLELGGKLLHVSTPERFCTEIGAV